MGGLDSGLSYHLFFPCCPKTAFLMPLSLLPSASLFYLLVIYGNIKFLFPHYYEKGQKIKYIVFSIILLVGGGLARGFLAMWVWEYLFCPKTGAYHHRYHDKFCGGRFFNLSAEFYFPHRHCLF